MDLTQVLALLAAGVLAVTLSRRLGMGSVLGYLAAGVALGPSGFGLIGQVAEVRHLAEFGVVFLLFLIGIELKPARLWVMRRLVFGLGTAQLLVSGAAIAGIGLLLELPPRAALVIGLGLALSSTAFGLQLLAERGQLGSLSGRAGLAILLLQDIAVVPLLALVALFAGGSTLTAGLGFALLETIAIIAAVVLAGRFLLDPLLHLAAASRQPEIFTATTLLLVLGMGWLMEYAGLSMALGAFLAGVILADSHFRHQVTADVLPFRGLLLGLFFMAVGLSLDLSLLQAELGLLLGLVLTLLAVKTLLIWVLVRPLGLRGWAGLRLGLLLSQAGEFGFVLFGFAGAQELFPAHLVQELILVIGLSMTATPLLLWLVDAAERRFGKASGAPLPAYPAAAPERRPVFIAGFGRVGQRIATLLRDTGMPYLVLERDAQRVADGREQGFEVYFGDSADPDVLQAAGLPSASMLVIAFDQAEAAEQLVSYARHRFPGLPIHVRGRDRAHCERLSRLGATTTVSENLEASLHLTESVLLAAGTPAGKTRELVESFRRDYYRDLAADAQPPAAAALEQR
ncbi:MAG: hypothetical protein RLZ44_825 [Pseudomonadota bacterium]